MLILHTQSPRRKAYHLRTPSIFPPGKRAAGKLKIAEAADVSGTVKPKSLERWSTDELQTAIYSGMLDNVQECEAGRILRERELAPDRKLARRVYNNAAWTLAFSLGTFIVALAIFWRIASSMAYRKLGVAA